MSKSEKNNKLFDVEKSTSTFMYLMTKYRNQKKKKKNTDGMYIVKAIDDKRHQLERDEKDNMYIYKEAKNTAHINQELINMYGVKAKTQAYDVSNFQTPMKLGKKKFFDPTKEDYLKPSTSLKKLQNKGVIQLPLIYNSKLNFNQFPLLTYNNSRNLSKNNPLSKSYQNKEKIIYKQSRNNPNNSDFSLDSYKKSSSYSHLKDTVGNNKRINSPSTLTLRDSEKNILTEVSKKSGGIKFRNKNDNFLLNNRDIFSYNGNYIARLSSFKDQCIKEERRKRHYFNLYDYGCHLSKEKYDYLTKKYFDND